MFNNKQIEELEAKLFRLAEVLKENGAIGSVGPYVFGHAPNRNEKLARDIKNIVTELNSQANTIAALMEYFEVEYVEETIKEIRTIK